MMFFSSAMLKPVSFCSWSTYVNAGLPLFLAPCFGSQSSRSLITSSFFLQQCKGTFGKKATCWLEWEAKQRGIHIQHHRCGHGGERYLCGYSADGYHPESKTVFEFQGCYWHGCVECFPEFDQRYEQVYIDRKGNPVTRADKLDYPGLPPYWFWYSELKNDFILSPKEYEECNPIFHERGMKTFGDWLEYYNNLDVSPFLEALQTMKSFYTGLGVDICKDAVSLPGVSMQYVLQHYTPLAPKLTPC